MGKGIAIFLFKQGLRTNIDNYRPITLLPSIRKIWAAIISNRIFPFLNLLTDEHQCPDKTNKSTLYIIYDAYHKCIRNKINGQILLDRSEAFDKIHRRELRWVLYKKVSLLTYLR